MNFQILPNQFDKISEHRWKIALGVISGVIFLIVFSYFTYRQPLTFEETNNLINKSKNLKRIDSLCENLPKPEDFRLVSKVIGGNSRGVSISHYYQSETEYEKIKTSYLGWFTQNGWKLEYQNSLDFNKDNLIIHINEAYRKEAKYVTYCAEEQ